MKNWLFGFNRNSFPYNLHLGLHVVMSNKTTTNLCCLCTFVLGTWMRAIKYKRYGTDARKRHDVEKSVKFSDPTRIAFDSNRFNSNCESRILNLRTPKSGVANPSRISRKNEESFGNLKQRILALFAQL